MKNALNIIQNISIGLLLIIFSCEDPNYPNDVWDEEDIGNACAFLISNEASKISGQVIAVDGNTEKMD